MPTLIATLGLPGSGKTTWAKGFLMAKPAGTWVRVNKDSLRTMLYFGTYEPAWEANVVVARDMLIGTYLTAGVSVVVDDTNFGRHLDHLRHLAGYHSSGFEVQDFTDVPLSVCLERDAKRLPRVGEDVIMDMHRKFLAESEPASGGQA